jgi:hypothetical protein
VTKALPLAARFGRKENNVDRGINIMPPNAAQRQAALQNNLNPFKALRAGRRSAATLREDAVEEW